MKMAVSKLGYVGFPGRLHDFVEPVSKPCNSAGPRRIMSCKARQRGNMYPIEAQSLFGPVRHLEYKPESVEWVPMPCIRVHDACTPQAPTSPSNLESSLLTLNQAQPHHQAFHISLSQSLFSHDL